MLALQMTLSPLHWVYTATSPDAPFEQRRPTAAKHLIPGQHHVWTARGPAGMAVLEPLVAAERITDTGLMNPLTLHGETATPTSPPDMYGCLRTPAV